MTGHDFVRASGGNGIPPASSGRATENSAETTRPALFEAAARAGLSRLVLARATMRAYLKSGDKKDLEAWLLAESSNGWIKEISDLMDRAKAEESA